nr:hypothetical protein [Tanacetum cinerariifolium]
MVRLWWLLWPQTARSPPQWWRQTAEHNEAPLGVAPPQPDTTCVAVPSSDRHHDGGGGGSGVKLVVVPGTVAAALVVPAVGGDAWLWWMVDPIDRDTGRHFWGSPENFFGGGSRPEMVVAGQRWPAAGRKELCEDNFAIFCSFSGLGQIWKVVWNVVLHKIALESEL